MPSFGANEFARDTGKRAARGLAQHPGVSNRLEDGGLRDKDDASDHDNGHRFGWREINRILFIVAAAGALWFQRSLPLPHLTAIGVIACLVGGYPIFKEAVRDVIDRRMTMELSMMIAIVAALLIREVFTALIITLFVLVAEILEGTTVGRGRRAIHQLLDFLPQSATVKRPGGWEETSIEGVRAGDVVLVRPGSRVPVDGGVIGGHSFVDESAITGESMPAEKSRDSVVYAGTMNQSGSFEILVRALGRDSTFGRIIDAVERAEQSRAPIQKTADRLAGYLVYFALAGAGLTFLITQNIRSTISVVIVAGACGIAAGTPLAILGGIGQAARRGAIIKGGLYLEKLAEADTILLDKTGTVTFGLPEVREIQPSAGVDKESLINAAAIAESRSEHPVAKAILRKASELGIPYQEPDRFDYVPGRGVVAAQDGEEIVVGNAAFLRAHGIMCETRTDSNTDAEVLVARDGMLLGAIRVADLLRPESKQAIQALKGMNLKTILLTGDARGVAASVAQRLGVDEFDAEMLPEQKLEKVRQLLDHGHVVAMVGDGINDAPALMQASVGVAMGSGTDVARESANVVLIGNDLSKLVVALRIARQCRRIILQNFTGTLVVDGIGIGLAACGFLNPVLAALIHVTSELTFILNSARLIPDAMRRSAPSQL